MKKWDQAISDFTNSLNYNPEDKSAYYYIAVAKVGKEEFEQAKKYAELCFQSEEMKGYCYYIKGQILYLYDKNFSQAKECFYKAVEYNPEFQDVVKYYFNRMEGKSEAESKLELTSYDSNQIRLIENR